jgi:CheY-like chemotaxis protein
LLVAKTEYGGYDLTRELQAERLRVLPFSPDDSNLSSIRFDALDIAFIDVAAADRSTLLRLRTACGAAGVPVVAVHQDSWELGWIRANLAPDGYLSTKETGKTLANLLHQQLTHSSTRQLGLAANSSSTADGIAAYQQPSSKIVALYICKSASNIRLDLQILEELGYSVQHAEAGPACYAAAQTSRCSLAFIQWPPASESGFDVPTFRDLLKQRNGRAQVVAVVDRNLSHGRPPGKEDGVDALIDTWAERSTLQKLARSLPTSHANTDSPQDHLAKWLKTNRAGISELHPLVKLTPDLVAKYERSAREILDALKSQLPDGDYNTIVHLVRLLAYHSTVVGAVHFPNVVRRLPSVLREHGPFAAQAALGAIEQHHGGVLRGLRKRLREIAQEK